MLKLSKTIKGFKGLESPLCSASKVWSMLFLNSSP